MWFKFFSVLVVAMTFTGVARADKVVDVEARQLFVPVGFDDNDEVVVVLDGYLRDTCHKMTEAVVQKDLAHNTIQIQQRARVFEGGVCLDMTVPYTNVIHLGALPTGSFTIATNQGKVIERLNVNRAASPGPDDHLYAPVDSARIADGKVVLEGRFTNTCLQIQEVKVEHTGNTIQVLPIMSLVPETQAGGKCEATEVAFEQSVALPALNAGRYLLHVRSLNGQSVNIVFAER